MPPVAAPVLFPLALRRAAWNNSGEVCPQYSLENRSHPDVKREKEGDE